MSAKDGNVVSGMADIEVMEQVLAVVLNKVLDFIEERLTRFDMAANAAYICF
jgi:hypothetical protein